jgi:hypothetical protein
MNNQNFWMDWGMVIKNHKSIKRKVTGKRDRIVE